MFQRATCTAQTLGIFDRTHDATFDAVWKTGELATGGMQQMIELARWLVAKESK